LVERAPGISVEEIVASTAGRMSVPAGGVPEMAL
jgi:3-oxoacid CoA-transferase subunit B